jgi:transposase
VATRQARGGQSEKQARRGNSLCLTRWEGLTRFLDDGRIEIDSNIVERSIRRIALNRKSALFAGSEGGAVHWAVLASLIETCKLNQVDPEALSR